MRILVAFALFVAVTTTIATADAVKPRPLAMTDADTGLVIYADACSNGGNYDAANRTKYIARMLANKASKIAQLKATLLAEDPETEVTIGDWTQTFNQREGCGEYMKSYSAFVFVRSKNSNEHLQVARFLITIDDDLAGPERKLSVRSIAPVSVRDVSAG